MPPLPTRGWIDGGHGASAPLPTYDFPTNPTPIATTLGIIAAVDIHRANRRASGDEAAHQSLRRAMNINSTITGTASTPLMTALQYSAEIGLIGVKFSAMPIPADSASTA